IVLIDMQSFFLGFPWEESLRNDGGGQTTQFISTRQFGVREEAHMVVWVRYSRESVRISTVQEDAGSIVSPLALDNFGHAFELARANNNLVKDKPVAQDLQFEILDSWPPDPDSSIYS